MLTPADIAAAVATEEKAWQQVCVLIEQLAPEQQLRLWRALNEHKRAVIARMQVMAGGVR